MLRAPLALLCVLLMGSVNAQTGALTVEATQADIANKQTEYDNYNLALQTQMNQAKQMKEQLSKLREQSKKLEREKAIALEEMNSQFQKMIDDPSLDIASARLTYTESVNAHKQNKLDIQNQLAAVQEKEREVASIRVSKHSLLNTLESLKEQLNNSRVERLYSQFNKSGTLSVQHAVDCDLEEVISECIRRTEQLAKQKASKRYLDKIFTELSESATASAQRNAADTSVKVESVKVTNKGFTGVAKYSVAMDVGLKGNLTRKQACQLLELNERYCVEFPGGGEVAKKTESQKVKYDANLMYELTIRSNVFDDEVYIDGVSYGSTKLSVMLPAGEHSVEVIKLGYQSYVEKIELTENRLIRVNLNKDAQSFAKGEKIQDILSNDKQGPRLVAIPAGGFQMGDITGRGLDNERPVVSYKIEASFGIGEKEITVGDFGQFIAATNYVTVAEQGKGCAYYSNSEPKYDMQMNWRNPGYEQDNDYPVVCVTLDDAKAYVDWLSTSTGKTYRLPTEGEWEYAARAGSDLDYWWGDAIGSNNANCGWCGSKWSNNSASPTGTFKRNGYGLYDVIGNVWEWSDTGSDIVSVVRGGAWNFAPSLARVSTRLEIASDFRSNYIGFRVARDR
ncbi:MAG: sulfatase activating formylglycine-generating enzyme [Psychrosphaera sp.]|jgi:formylglycine-generating enzyme required for sulfatase activity|uniref:formylglycine-generating enzyme family protein n=1 Tax=Psychrosphaera sp. F3M07 TaxID=2841560 RepID=UPI001C088A1E|nr:formylglycine-generating enzyme family protein [Psychrosphaera sp. F3M07]MBU2919440.1 SUMF1/EgtB/PvdO family nonheme iron enzyme [Psychrosphaera sp. F3M07]